MDKVFYWIAYALMAVVGFVVSVFHLRIKEVENHVQELRVHLPENYVKKVDLKDLRDEIMGAFDRIYDKLDDKQDRK